MYPFVVVLLLSYCVLAALGEVLTLRGELTLTLTLLFAYLVFSFIKFDLFCSYISFYFIFHLTSAF